MKELIPIKTEKAHGREIKTVNARDLHEFLEVGKDFSTWIKDRINTYGFVEGQDFVISEVLRSPVSGSSKARPQKLIDYHLTIDMAKEISMVERNEKGKEARQYFLECERKALQPIDPIQALNDPEAMRGILLTYTEKVIALEKEKKEMLPKVEGFDRIAKADGLTCITDTAKSLQMRPKDLFGWMSANKWIYRRAGGKGWLAYQNRIQQGLLSHKVITVQTSDGREKVIENVKVTPKGLTKLSSVFHEEATA